MSPSLGTLRKWNAAEDGNVTDDWGLGLKNRGRVKVSSVKKNRDSKVKTEKDFLSDYLHRIV